jgi:NADH dehydrogenase
MVLMCGATGLLGERVTRRLAARGAPLRLLLRDGASDAVAREVGADVVRGDLRRPETLGPAVEGAETVVTTATAIARALDGERVDLRAVDGHGALALVSAAEAAGVQRFVYTSFAGLDDDAARRIPLGAAKRAVERRLAGSSMRTVSVRPDSFQEIWLSPITQFDWRRGRVIVFGRGETIARYVAADDVAEAIAVLTVAQDPPASVEFGGPEPLTRHEAVRVFEAATGRRIRTHHVPRSALRAGLRVLRRRRPDVASVMGLSLLADERDATWTEEPLRALGIEPRSVTAFAAQVARDA